LQPDGIAFGRGTRKSCFAWATIKEGSGIVTINSKSIIDYFEYPIYRKITLRALLVAQVACHYDVKLTVRGSGLNS